MPFNTNGRNAMLSGGLGNAISHISVHDAVPDDTGSAEVAGTTRQAVTWTAVALGVRDNNAQISHTMPAASTAVAYGFWSALTVGTYYGHALVGSTKTGFGTVDSAGVTANAIQSAAHGLVNGERVVVYNTLAEALPTGLTEGTVYFVVGATTNTFQVSLTSGGAAVDITAQGELYFSNGVPEAFGSGGSLVAATGAIDLDTNVI